MALLRLTHVNVRIPIYDSNSLRLFRRGSPVKGNVGSHEFIGASGVLAVQALSDITFTLQDGERLALIGHNGAGKTTLLRYLAGVYPAINGQYEREGSIAMYGGASTMNPDASGYENICLAAQLGHLPKSELDSYIRDIEEFTELGEYLSMPIRIYSAGMVARLSFAMATMHAPDILLIDEGIGAGDARFADKVEKRIHDFTQKAKIMIVASHSDELLRKMCNKGAVFEAGRMIFFGDIEEALRRYQGSR